MMATVTGPSKKLRAMTKERVATTAIRPAAIKVKGNCGAIYEIAP
jgi:hypothetical protein